MHYADLSPCDYDPGGYDSASWRAPFLSIGWLESSHEYNRGICDKSVLEKLRGFVPLSRSKYSHLRFRGVHHCSLCETDTSDLLGIGWSQEMLIVPGEGVVYAAPSGIVHYIESHGYLPPPAFTAAVKHCPEYGSDDYQEALRVSNANKPPPIVTADEWSAEFRRQVEEAKQRRKQK